MIGEKLDQNSEVFKYLEKLGVDQGMFKGGGELGLNGKEFEIKLE